jgi:hypothetical protein
MEKLLQDGPYELMTTNPFNKMTNYKLKVSNPQIPRLYGLPKIHKNREFQTSIHRHKTFLNDF